MNKLICKNFQKKNCLKFSVRIMKKGIFYKAMFLDEECSFNFVWIKWKFLKLLESKKHSHLTTLYKTIIWHTITYNSLKKLPNISN